MSDHSGTATSTGFETLVAWLATCLSCAYYLWAYAVLSRHSSAFKSAFAGMGAEIPAPTRFIVENQAWLYPAIFGAAAVLLLAKELALHNKRLSLAITLLVALITLFVVDSIKTVLFFPVLNLFEKLA